MRCTSPCATLFSHGEEGEENEERGREGFREKESPECDACAVRCSASADDFSKVKKGERVLPSVPALTHGATCVSCCSFARSLTPHTARWVARMTWCTRANRYASYLHPSRSPTLHTFTVAGAHISPLPSEITHYTRSLALFVFFFFPGRAGALRCTAECHKQKTKTKKCARARASTTTPLSSIAPSRALG